MIDQELFDLCKQVYEVTGWDDTDSIVNSSGDRTFSGYLGQRLYEYFVPLYNSDYLLEKLPERIFIGKQYRRWLSMDNLGSDGWQFSYRAERTAPIYASVADTPLKALLKLVLKLHEEKLL